MPRLGGFLIDTVLSDASIDQRVYSSIVAK
jgi:hypothetical protein